MSTVLPTTEDNPPSQASKPQRMLACVLCQQRKVKCERKYPCANCIRFRAQCIPATQVSRRQRRRFPERELLERIRKYEELLRQNNIKFEPFLKDSSGENESGDSDDEQLKPVGEGGSSPATTANSNRGHEPKYAISKKLPKYLMMTNFIRSVWRAISQEFRGPDYDGNSSDDDVGRAIVKNAWDHLFESNDHLLFGSRKTRVDISTLHPDPIQIFRLWQLFLDNVNPLLKVAHAPSLQGRVIEAASNVLNIDPALEALIFSIYCMAVLSLAADDCQAMFGSSKADLLMNYQLGCQQALLNCGFLRSGDRDCLTALYLYLVSVRPSTVPQSLSSMLGVAIRIAQRMGIHSESALAKCTALEAEIRRRLWWSLVLFDTRIGELAGFKPAALTPEWDCRIPLNVNDSDFPPEIKEPPQVQRKSTEALFAVVRSDIGNFIRHTRFHLKSATPDLKSVAKGIENSELASLEKTIEDKYLKFCDPENPLHFMTIWTTRSYIAKCHLAEHRSRYSSSSAHQTEAQRNSAMSYALRMLDCDTKIITSPLTKGFLWLVHIYFPFPAYIQVVDTLKHRPTSDQAEHAWEVMSDNYSAHFDLLALDNNLFFKIFMDVILQAWRARETAFKRLGKPLVTPRIVSSIKHKMAQNTPNPDAEQPQSVVDMGIDNFSMPMPMNFGSNDSLYDMGMQDGYGPGAYYNMPGLTSLDVDINRLNWSAIDWDLANAPMGESTGLPPHY